MKKIVALTVLFSIPLMNIPISNAVWVHKTEFLNHAPIWLLSKEARNANKDRQLCKLATSFDILDDEGNIKYTYYPQGCQPEKEIIISDDIKKIESKEEESKEEESKEEESKEEESKEEEPKDEVEINNFIDDLFGDSLDNSSNTGSSAEPTEPTDDFLKDIFGNNNDNNGNFSLKSSKLLLTFKNFSQNKIKIRVGTAEANALANDMEYNIKIANFLKQIDKEFKIDSIKNSFTKNISNVTYSLYTYNNTTDIETKKAFKSKLVRDLKKLKNKYKILKFKDQIISKTLESRGKL